MMIMAPDSYLWRKMDNIVSQNRSGEQILGLVDGLGRGVLVVVVDVDEDIVVVPAQVAHHPGQFAVLRLDDPVPDVAGEELRSVKDRSSFIATVGQATRQSGSGFYRLTAQLMAGYHTRIAPVARVELAGNIPYLQRSDGTVIVILSLNYVFRTQAVADKLHRIGAVLAKSGRDSTEELWLIDKVDGHIRNMLETGGGQLRKRLATGSGNIISRKCRRGIQPSSGEPFSKGSRVCRVPLGCVRYFRGANGVRIPRFSSRGSGTAA